MKHDGTIGSDFDRDTTARVLRAIRRAASEIEALGEGPLAYRLTSEAALHEEHYARVLEDLDVTDVEYEARLATGRGFANLPPPIDAASTAVRVVCSYQRPFPGFGNLTSGPESVAAPFFHGTPTGLGYEPGGVLWPLATWTIPDDEETGATDPDSAAERGRVILLRALVHEWHPGLLVRATLERLNGIASNHAYATIANTLAKKHAPDDEKHRERLATAARDSVRALLDRHGLRFDPSADSSRLTPPASWDAAWASATNHDAIDGVFFLDEHFAAHVATIGDAGAGIAAKVRESSAVRVEDYSRGELGEGELCRLWFDLSYGHTGLPALEILVDVLWRDVVSPQLEREKRNPPALTYQVHEDVARIHSRAHVLETANGQRRMRFDDSDPIVLAPSMADEAVIKLVERGANLLGSVNGHRALRWEVVEGYERVMRDVPDARVLRVESGWAPLAERLGMRSKKAAEELRAIVYAQAAVRFTLPTGDTGNLIAIREQPARGRRRGMIEITLGTMLLPHYGEELGERLHGRDRSEARRLVPLIATLPPMVGREREHGAQATLSMLVVQELRTHARTLASDGSVPISPERLAELAGKAGLPTGMVPRVIDRWTQDGHDGAAFLESPSRDRYTLGKAHARELAFLLASGRRELGGAAAGKRSVEARGAKRRRLTKGEAIE